MDVTERRAFWTHTIRQWHWISSAVCLVGMLLFAGTGITLNHAAQIEAAPTTMTRQAKLPLESLHEVQRRQEQGNAVLPAAVSSWLVQELAIETGARPAEWTEDEIYLALPRPGGDAWLTVDRRSGEVRYESTRRGAISYLNDLHKGRNTGTAWSWFIDIFAVACLVFCVTGLLLLQRHAGSRPGTWPVVGLGVVLPLLLIILFIH